MTTDRRPGSTPLLLWVALAATLATVCPPPAAAAEPGSDPKAVEIAERVVATGLGDAWDDVRYVSFGFAGRRSHLWDRETGRHRVDMTTREGDTVVVIHDLDSREGRAWKNGTELTGDELAGALENAYGAWINDTYWLLAPYKMLDPGVTLTYAGEETWEGTTYDKVELSFGGVGLTPGDRYWMWVDRDTGLVDRWDYRLQHQEPDAEPTSWRWTGWEDYRGVRLADSRIQLGEDRELSLAPIELPESVDERRFEAP